MEIEDNSQTAILQQYVDGVIHWAKNGILDHHKIINVNICSLHFASLILQIIIH